MIVWRLMAHHPEPETAISWTRKDDRVAIGWGSADDEVLISGIPYTRRNAVQCWLYESAEETMAHG